MPLSMRTSSPVLRPRQHSGGQAVPGRAPTCHAWPHSHRVGPLVGKRTMSFSRLASRTTCRYAVVKKDVYPCSAPRSARWCATWLSTCTCLRARATRQVLRQRRFGARSYWRQIEDFLVSLWERTGLSAQCNGLNGWKLNNITVILPQ